MTDYALNIVNNTQIALSYRPDFLRKIKPEATIDGAILASIVLLDAIHSNKLGESFGIGKLTMANMGSDLSDYLTDYLTYEYFGRSLVNYAWALDDDYNCLLMEKIFLPKKSELYRLCGNNWSVIFKIRQDYDNLVVWFSRSFMGKYIALMIYDIVVYGDCASFETDMMMYSLMEFNQTEE